jgi:hypothetical protein
VVRGGFPIGDAAVDEVFGKKEQGGLAQFLDSYSEAAVSWDKCVLGRTAIDAVTGTASEHLLFHLEVVPEGTKFQVRIRGKSFGEKRWQDAVELIERGLRPCNRGTLRWGAGESNGWGRGRWTLDAVRVMEAEERKRWLADPRPLDEALGAIPANRKDEVATREAESTGTSRTLDLVLRFDGHPFLVNDPPKTGTQAEKKHGHAARRTPDGRLLLPAESFRGVFAHQAARIAQTRRKDGNRQTVKRGTAKKLPSGVSALTRLFGAAGWSSTIEVRDFVEITRDNGPCQSNSRTQQFVAIDRFTGGGAEDRKFDAEGGWQPWLKGSLTVNLDRLENEMGRPEPALGLLALTLRDLAEGDLAFGWGSGKGYGWATVDTGGLNSVEWVEHSLAGWCEGRVVDWIRAWEREEANNG